MLKVAVPFHLAAMAAYRSTEYCVSPLEYTGVSSWMAILLSVRVPVLSEHRMAMPARSSMADRRVTIAPESSQSRVLCLRCFKMFKML